MWAFFAYNVTVAVLSLWLFCHCGRFVMWPFCHVAVLSLWPFCQCGHFVTWPFCIWPFCHVAVLSRGRFVFGRFECGRFVSTPNFLVSSKRFHTFSTLLVQYTKIK